MPRAKSATLATLALALSLLSDIPSTAGVTFPLRARARPRSNDDHGLSRRTGMVFGGKAALDNRRDMSYYTNITIGGAPFNVLIDTGSSDLWVTGDIPETTNLSYPLELKYAVGSANGHVNTADLLFDQFSIPDQAYLRVVETNDHVEIDGVLGLGPRENSRVRRAFASDAGDPPLERIFAANPTAPNYLTVLLSRELDDAAGPDALTDVGQLTVTRLIDAPGLDAILDQPRLRVPDIFGDIPVNHWQTTLDAEGIIGPDGRRIRTRTTVNGTANPRALEVVFDTGYTFPQLPKHVVDAIYGRVPGARFEQEDGGSGVWTIPCGYELNVTFVFGEVEVPIAPLDLSMLMRNDDGERVCVGTFQVIPDHVADHRRFGPFDAILGMAFLRNVYLLIDFGDYIDGSSTELDDPFIQLLPITDRADAHADFVNIRLRGVDTTASQPALLPEGRLADDDSTFDPETFASNNDDDDDDGKPFYRQIWFIAAVAGGGAALLGLVGLLLACALRRRRSSVKSEAAFVPPMAGAGAYRPLGTPTPAYGPATHGAGYGYPYQQPRYHYGGA